jgi:2-oxoglutarate ferredoxin oxidoreductase subunit beta
VARTHDMDRKHMMETFRRAYEHHGAALVEVYQNCNVFNDGAFEAITSKDNRPSMLVPLEHGKPVRFGPELEKGVVIDKNASAHIVDVAEVGEQSLVVHDEASPDPTLAFALSRLASGPYSPTPIGVFRAVERPDYGSLVQGQLVEAAARKGPGDLAALLRSGTTWTVG